MKQKVIAVAGPTASGKTALAISLAKKLSGEVVSNDSMQVYRGMEIGTAAPTKEETDAVPHHLVGIISPDTPFSCADYAARAKAVLEDMSERGKLPIFCGGTGLYLDSVLKVSEFSEGDKNEALRQELQLFADENGADALHERLREIDPEAADAIHKNNVRRVIRAIEIFETTGITKTEWDKKSKHIDSPYDDRVIVLDFLSRELLYSRIDKRVDIMFDSGLENEVRALYDKGLLSPEYPAYQAIGYKEFIPYFKGEISLADVSDAIKLATRHYAKRQVTWFKRYENALFIHPDNENGEMRTLDDITEEALFRI